MNKIFQFHKGSIKTQMHAVYGTNVTNFNSIKVRLRQHMCFVEDNNHVFQFHKGSIKTCGKCTIQPGVLLFQFHKGSIKTDISGPLWAKEPISIP